jgi:hypothetical protein
MPQIRLQALKERDINSERSTFCSALPMAARNNSHVYILFKQVIIENTEALGTHHQYKTYSITGARGSLVARVTTL